MMTTQEERAVKREKVYAIRNGCHQVLFCKRVTEKDGQSEKERYDLIRQKRETASWRMVLIYKRKRRSKKVAANGIRNCLPLGKKERRLQDAEWLKEKAHRNGRQAFRFCSVVIDDDLITVLNEFLSIGKLYQDFITVVTDYSSLCVPFVRCKQCAATTDNTCHVFQIIHSV